MYKYKRGINDLGKIKNIQVTFTNGIDTSYSMFSTLETRKIYNGMYIKDKKVLLENLIEKVEIGDKTYRIGQVDTKVKAISSDEYITLVDLEKNEISYELGSLKYTKRICFDIKDTKALVIEYDIENEADTKAIFNILPFVTYRDIFDVKTSNVLRFNSRETSNSTFLNLSVTNKVNLSLKSIGMEWLKEKSFIKSVKHEYINQNLIKDTYEEDLCIPGRFIFKIDPKEKKKVYILASDVDLDETKLVPDKIFDNLDKYNTEIVNNIDESFVELIELTTSIQNNNISDSVVATIPYSIKLDDISKIISDDNKKESIEMLLEYQDVVKSIEGKYLSLGQIKEAKKLLLDVKSKIGVLDSKNIQDVEILENILALKLWTVESINRLMQKDTTLNLFFDFVKDTIYIILKNPNLKTITYNSIELVSLFYNTLKIYQNMLIALKQDDASVYEEESYILNLVEKEFWIEDKRILKNRLDDTEHIATFNMIYTLSLSYPLLTNTMGIKLLDTIFKELYTPYGLREYSKFSNKNDGLIYPKYMTHFVKANLRQNGVTRASQKLAYNLAKELLQDISKYINGGIKKVYSEKGIAIDTLPYDILTNAEMIRLYNMLT